MSKLGFVEHKMNDYMDSMKTLFVPGVKMTVVVRKPDDPGCGLVMTDDDLQEVIAEIQRRAASESKQP